VKGIDIWGAYNNLEVTTRGGFPKSNDIIFEESAEGNQINVIQGKEPFEPLDIITDKALKPTNQIIWTGGPMSIRKIKATSGTFTYTQRLYPAMVRIIDSDVAEVTLMRGDDIVEYKPSADILMSVGDQLKIESTVPPNLLVIPFKIN